MICSANVVWLTFGLARCSWKVQVLISQLSEKLVILIVHIVHQLKTIYLSVLNINRKYNILASLERGLYKSISLNLVALSKWRWLYLDS